MLRGRASVVIVVLVALAPVPVIYGLGRRGLDAIVSADRELRGAATLERFGERLEEAVESMAGRAPFARIEEGRVPRIASEVESAAMDPVFAAAREAIAQGTESNALAALEALRAPASRGGDAALLSTWTSLAALERLGRSDLAARAREALTAVDRDSLTLSARRFLDLLLAGDEAKRLTLVDAWLDELAGRDADLGEVSWLALMTTGPEQRSRISDLVHRESIALELTPALAALGERRAFAVTGSGGFVIDAPIRWVSRVDPDTLLPVVGVHRSEVADSLLVPKRVVRPAFLADLGDTNSWIPLEGTPPFSGFDAHAALAGGVAIYALLVLALGVAIERGRARAESLVNARTDLVAQVAHELRTPLTVLRMYGESLAAGRVPEASRGDYVATMSSEATRLGALVDRVARAARDEDPESPLDAECEVSTVVAPLVAAWSRVAEDRGGGLIARLLASGNAAIGAEDLRLALDVLLDNAVSYGVDSRGAARVEVELRDDDRACTIVVRDFGPGIPSSERGRLFERFARGEAGKRLARHGAGMGLFLARRTIRAAGGDLVLEFPTDGGTRATISLPTVREGAR